ncbi:MAG TPA: hypothetical protein VE959_34740 [Bryobacteraceae bacterium]|nr:hypothetical protein [Bryobacteraceae bacterium]
MTAARERYRKLPGRRRGFIKGSSVWLGAGHLLLVRSSRFREEYKRFQLRDIQAIVVARTPRFAISTRAFTIGVLWLVAYMALRNTLPWAPAVLWSGAAGLVGAWIYVCAARSCACRIYTAVSRDDLPSLYRTWTARKFLAEVEPRIAQEQGVVESNWAEAVAGRAIGPPLATGPAPGAASPAATAAPARRRTLASDVFLASLFADALLNVLTLHSVARGPEWAAYGLAGVEVAGAIAIFFQYHRGILRAGLQKLAIATLIVMGVFYYAKQIIAGLATSSPASTQILPDPQALAAQPAYIFLREADAGIAVILGLAGLILSFLPDGRESSGP